MRRQSQLQAALPVCSFQSSRLAMLYLAAINLAGLLFITTFFSVFSHIAARSSKAALVDTGVLLAAVLMLVPFSLEIAAAISGRESSLGVYSGAISGGGAVLGLAVFGVRLSRLRGTASPGFWAVGSNVLGLLLSAYIGMVALQHEAFYAGHDSDDIGMANLGFLREAGEAKDVACTADLVIVKGIKSGVGAYRCPTVLVLGKFSDKPFIPWPGYVEGESAQMAMAISKMQAEAEKVSPTN